MATTLRQYHVLQLVGFFGAALTVHWLITPINHPQASTVAYLWAWTQVLGGLTLGIWAHRRIRAIEASGPRTAPSIE